jgi:hypothetical protein
MDLLNLLSLLKRQTQLDLVNLLELLERKNQLDLVNLLELLELRNLKRDCQSQAIPLSS